MCMLVTVPPVVFESQAILQIGDINSKPMRADHRTPVEEMDIPPPLTIVPSQVYVDLGFSKEGGRYSHFSPHIFNTRYENTESNNIHFMDHGRYPTNSESSSRSSDVPSGILRGLNYPLLPPSQVTFTRHLMAPSGHRVHLLLKNIDYVANPGEHCPRVRRKDTYANFIYFLHFLYLY